ncbi:MAG TPA: hypothetical protein PLV92_30650, partial [Pirellulaceae bacterium]|nr:hypothetical protein [Pirellulaceae bacterium]
MAIAVTCPGCKARFAVDDKFAGKTGPCPKCKTSIKIPEKVEEVKIHAPEPVGTKDSKGAPVIKPIKRTDVKFTPAMIATLVGSILAVLVGAITLRFMYPEKIPEKAAAAAASAPPASAASSSIAARRPKPPTPIREVPVLFLALGAIALAPALCWSGYSFLRDDELAPMMGKELWTRVSICSAAYVLIWGIYFGLRMTPLL